MPKRSRGPHLKWRPDRKTWEIVEYTAGRRQRHATGTGERAQAETILAEFLGQRHRTGGIESQPSERLIGDILADYVQERGQFLKSPKTLSFVVDALAPFWGARPASDIREETCRAYWQERERAYLNSRKETKGHGRKAEKINPATVARELAVLSAAVNHDWRAGRLSAPRPVWKPKFDNRKDRWLTRKEAAKLLRAARAGDRARDYLPLFILIGLYTAARHRAILDLTWDRVDLAGRLIDFHQRGTERTAKGKALIKIPRRLAAHLARARARGAPRGFVIHENQRGFKSLKKTYAKAVKAAGLTGVSPHTLRHTAASWMAQKGVAFPVIARYLGHADSRTTERVYAHHSPDYLQAAADALDDFNRPITAPITK